MGPIDDYQDYERSSLNPSLRMAAGIGFGPLMTQGGSASANNGAKGILSKLIQEASHELASLEQALGVFTESLAPVLKSEDQQATSNGVGQPYPVGSQVAASVMTLTAQIRSLKERVISVARRVEV
jgi:hypothetical protein